MPSAELDEKRGRLARWLQDCGSVAIGFSGGVDSTFLAVTAVDVLGGENVRAVLGVSASLAPDVHARSKALAQEFNIPVTEIETRELAHPDYIANRGDRCFHCKQELWSRLVPVAEAQGLAVVVDGTIVDDLSEHRPGRAAGARAGVKSPLAECGFTKADVRAAARERGIPIWDAPAAPCLASRVKIGVEVTTGRLAEIDRAEAALRAMGISGDLRVRHLGDAARVELPPELLAEWSAPDARAAIARAVQSSGFARVLLDARGYRRGALNERGSTDVTDITVTLLSPSRDTSAQ